MEKHLNAKGLNQLEQRIRIALINSLTPKIFFYIIIGVLEMRNNRFNFSHRE